MPHQTLVGTRRCRPDERINDVPSEATHPPHGVRGRRLAPRSHRLLVRWRQRATRPTTTATPSGEITVLTWRTDLVEDGTFDEYVEEFKAKYPDVTDVKFEGLTDYEGEVKTRMNTDELRRRARHPRLGDPGPARRLLRAARARRRRSARSTGAINDKSFEGQSYGIPVVGNVQGFVYNKRVWEEAGITEFPDTPEEFLDALQAIKDNGVEIAPLYTNYKDGWPLSQWDGWLGAVTADPDCEEQDRRVRHPVDRGQRLRRGRRPDLRRRRAGPDRGRPDDHQLGGVQAPPRHRRDRHDGRSARGRSRRCRRPRRLPARAATTSATCRSRSRSTARSTPSSAATTTSAST